MSALLSESDLKAWSGFGQRKKLESFLRQNKIPFTYGKGNKLITTQEAVDTALGVKKSAAAPAEQDSFF